MKYRKKITVEKTILVVTSSILFLLSCIKSEKRENLEFPQQLFVEATDVFPAIMEREFYIDTLLKKKQVFEKEFKNNGFLNTPYRDYIHFIFRYRNYRMKPLFKRIVNENDSLLLLKLLAINAIGKIADTTDFNYLITLFKDTNAVVREYVANALSHAGTLSGIEKIKAMMDNEPNGYVRETLRAACKRIQNGQGTTVNYLPQYDDSSLFVKIFSNEKIESNEKYYFKKKWDKKLTYRSNAHLFVYPHQQYKLMNDREYFRKISFGYQQGPDRFHVGEDSGWELEGLPVHSITDGYVVLIQHESSWGTLIAIESRIRNKDIITTFYGHLSECIDVAVGDFVTAGCKIGEIGAALTLANGGYRPHLHLGISPVEFKRSLITGFYRHTKYWFNPVSFLYKNVKTNPPSPKLRR